ASSVIVGTWILNRGPLWPQARNAGCVSWPSVATIQRMLGIDRRTARITWTVVLILLLLGILYRIRETLLVFAIALLLAYLLWPLVEYLDRRLPGRSRTPALAIVYLVLVGILTIIGFAIGSRVVAEASALAGRLPDLISRIQHATPPTAGPMNQSVKFAVFSTIRKQVTEHSRELLALLPEAGLKIVS